jgi:hypothetical protein
VWLGSWRVSTISGTVCTWSRWDELRGDPGVDRGGDGGRGVGSHDSRPWTDSKDSVGDWNLCASAGRSTGPVSLIFGRGTAIREGRCGGAAETLRGLSVCAVGRKDTPQLGPVPRWPLSVDTGSSAGPSKFLACSFKALLASSAVLKSPMHIDPLGVPSCRRATSTGAMGLRGNDALDLRAGVQGRFLTGVCGRSGSSTVKDRWNGHSVFSNCRILSKTSRSCWARRTSSCSSTGTSIRQYCGRRICKTNLLDSSSTHHAWLLGRIGWRAEPQLRKATDPGAR